MSRALFACPQRRQRGAALLLAMLTVTLVASFAAAALWQQWRAVEVETAERNQVQAAWILLGALDWSRVVLVEDARSDRNNPVDHLAEPWSVPLQEARLSTFLAAQNNISQVDDGSMDVQDAFLSGQIIDLQSRLNLRNLLQANGVAPNLRPLQRLFERLDLPQAHVAHLAQALRAAAAAKDEPGQALMPRTLGQLAWLGLPPEVVARLTPYATLLPEPTPVNLNTASAEVIWASIEGLDWARANQMVQQRASRPLRTLAEARTALDLPDALNTAEHAVFSRYFEAQGRLRLGDSIASERSVLYRQDLRVTTLWREPGDWAMPDTAPR